MAASALLLACLLDLLLGDPRWLPHPVRLMGLVAWRYEGLVRNRAQVKSPGGLRLAGAGLALALPLGAGAAAWGLIRLAELGGASLGTGMEILLAYTTLAGRDLADHALAVRRALAAGSLEQARRAVALIVGRDTEGLTEPEVVRATVETVAESAADGVVAPLFYLALGGAPLAMAFKAVSTLDSMVGHRDERYRDFGWASARLDDLANWFPARLTAGLMALAAGLLAGSSAALRRAWGIVRRDSGKHDSPNSGWPEAAMAGALRLQLGGVNHYDGLAVERPRLGDAVEALTAEQIHRALAVAGTAALLAVGLAAAANVVMGPL